jgi:predicted P-loop ATPase
MDNMLVLHGPQDVGKSTFVSALFGSDWSAEDLADIKSKDAMIGLRGKWAIEVAELDKMLRSEPETVKAFIARCVDPYRPPYGRTYVDQPRECVFIGNTNRDDFLRDPTGERRYWIVKADDLDVDAVRAWRDRMWSAAYQVAKQNKLDEPHWLSEEEKKALRERAANYKRPSVWLDRIEAWHEGVAAGSRVDAELVFNEIKAKLRERHMFNDGLGDFDDRTKGQIEDCFRALGFVRYEADARAPRLPDGRRSRRQWVVPERTEAGPTREAVQERSALRSTAN